MVGKGITHLEASAGRNGRQHAEAGTARQLLRPSAGGSSGEGITRNLHIHTAWSLKQEPMYSVPFQRNHRESIYTFCVQTC